MRATGNPIGTEIPTLSKNPNKMMAYQYNSPGNASLTEIDRPRLMNSTDCIVRLTCVGISGRDRHYLSGHNYHFKDDKFTLGCEGVGIVTELGNDCKKLQIGQKVVISSILSCGQCDYCQKQEFGLCDTMNSATTTDKLYGAKTCSVFGSGQLGGSVGGLQAEFARIPFADLNCLPVKQQSQLSDEELMLLSSTAPTAFHGVKLSGIRQGDIIAVAGSGPLGLLTAYFALFQGAGVISLDHNANKLEIARQLGANPINFEDADIMNKMWNATQRNGVNSYIDCVGTKQHAAGLLTEISAKMHLGVAKPSKENVPLIMNRRFHLTKKGGTVVLLGDYFGTMDDFDLEGLQHKGLTLQSTVAPIQKYWNEVLGLMENKSIDLSFLISHCFPFDKLNEGYSSLTSDKESLKVASRTNFGVEREAQLATGARVSKPVQWGKTGNKVTPVKFGEYSKLAPTQPFEKGERMMGTSGEKGRAFGQESRMQG